MVAIPLLLLEFQFLCHHLLCAGANEKSFEAAADRIESSGSNHFAAPRFNTLK
jgi:hypothetical protein